MPKEGSVAPKERINIKYKNDAGGVSEDVELPFKLLMAGDYTLRDDDTPLEERKPVKVNKSSFNDVMEAQKLSLSFNVEDRLSGEEDSEMTVNLDIKNLKDFRPESVASNVDELKALLTLREALVAVKGPLGSVSDFRKSLQELLSDEGKLQGVLKELGLED